MDAKGPPTKPTSNHKTSGLKVYRMQIEPMLRLMLDSEETNALYDLCATALEANILDGAALAFALAIVETCQQAEDEPEEQTEVMH
jgi:hypothetical protein